MRVLVATGATGTTVNTSSDGSYTKTGLANGVYTVQPLFSGYLFTPESQQITLTGVSRTDVNFTGEPVVPVIASLSPQKGTTDTRVVISGSGFGSPDLAVNKVRFGASDASIQSWKNTKIVVHAPAGSGSVLVTVITASGTSNGVAFSYNPPSRRNVQVLPSGDFQVLVFTETQTISSDSSQAVENMTIENITGAWYVVHPSIVGGVSGPDLPTADFMIGPFAVKSLGQVTFPKKSQLGFFADDSIDLGSCTPICDVQTSRILAALAMDLFWRAATGGPFPVNEGDQILFLAEQEADNPVVNLGVDMWQGNILGILNDLPDVLADPYVTALLTQYGLPAALPS